MLGELYRITLVRSNSMRLPCSLVLAATWLAVCSSSYAVASHRLLILDMGKRQEGENAQLLVIETESGKLIAHTNVGQMPELGLSPNGDLAAVVTPDFVGGRIRPNPRLRLYATSDLKPVETGLLPFTDRAGFMDSHRTPTVFFSPDQQEIIQQHLKDTMTDEKPLRWPYYSAVWGFVKPSLDADGFYKLARPAVKIPRCRLSTFLRLADWPKVQIWNHVLGVVEVVDVGSGKILSRLPLDYADDPALNVIDPAYLEKPEIGQLYMKMRANGAVVSDLAAGGPYAYYVPQPMRYRNSAPPGFLQKIELRADPPRVIRKGDERQPGLFAYGSAVSEAGGAVFVPLEKQENGRGIGKPTNRIRIYSTLDLKLQNEIEVSLASCDYLEPSRDGKYMYVLNREQAKVAVIDIATGKEVKVMENVGKYPVMIMALPETTEQK